MPHWQSRARLAIAAAAVAFAVVVALAFQRRVEDPGAPIARTDPDAVVETAGGVTFRVNRDREEVRVAYDELRTYRDKPMELAGVTVTTERAGGRTFTVTARQARIGDNETSYVLEGDVRLTTSDGLSFHSER